MAYFSIENLIIDDINFTFDIDMHEAIACIFDKKLARKLFLVLAGINKNEGNVKVLNENPFDNDNYFKTRALMDFSEKYLSTLRKDEISSAFLNKFNKDIDIDRFIKNVNEFSLRKEAIFDVKYTFTDLGNTLLNLSLFDALNSKVGFLLDISHGANTKELKEVVETKLLNKRYDALLCHASTIDAVYNFDSFLFLFGKEIIKIGAKEDVLLFNRASNLRHVIYSDNKYSICLNNYTKEKLHELSREKQEYKKMNLVEALKIIGESNEKK